MTDEIERLRAAAEAFQNEARILRGHLTDRDAEVERLRAELERCEQDWKDAARAALKGRRRSDAWRL
jgi:predicted RNase H-like nuclease (RuvC/YqgF family)